MEFAYIAIIVSVAIGLAIGTRILKNKGIIKDEDLLIIAKAFDLSLKIIAELNLSKEKQILKIGNIVYDAIEYVISISNNPSEMQELAYQFIFEKCKEFGIELTENRIQIITTLLTIGLSNKIGEEVII